MKNARIISVVLLAGLTYFFSISHIQAKTIKIDGLLSDWSQEDRLEIPPKSPIIATVQGYELYGRYENTFPNRVNNTQKSYKIALHRSDGSIGVGTTFWLDVDQNSSTGYLIWGQAGGVEYKIEISINGKPYLYPTMGPYLGTLLQHSIVSDGANGTNLEIDIPENLIGTPTEEIHLLIDVNDYNTVFLPSSYTPASNSYTIVKTAPVGVDCNMSNWKPEDVLGSEGSSSTGDYVFYGRYENNNYKLALRGYFGFNGNYPTGGYIGNTSTIWLNTDQDSVTGYQIWGYAGGAEYNISQATDGEFYLYSGAVWQTLIAGPLSSCLKHAQYFGSLLELEVPEELLNTPSGSGIKLLADVNNNVFLPMSYLPESNHYSLLKTPTLNPEKIQIDADKSDWNNNDRLDLGINNAVNNAELYGRYEDGKYKILLHHFTQVIAENTTLWINTDQNHLTGYQVWGFAGGAEYNVNIDANGIPYLYLNAVAQTYVSGSLEYAILPDGSGGSILELAIPEGFIGAPQGSSIALLLDVNDSVFMPNAYLPNSNNYILPRN